MNRVVRWGGLVLPVLLVAPAVPADAELTLLDGQILRGRSVEREGDLYMLAQEGGDILPLPALLVQEVREVDAPDTAPPDSGATEGIEDDLSVPDAPLPPLVDRDGTPERPRLHVQLPDDGEEASRFSQSVIDSNWLPRNYTSEKTSLDELDPSGWYRSPLESNFSLKSGFDSPEGQAQFRPSSQRRSLVRSNWKPRDGSRDE